MSFAWSKDHVNVYGYGGFEGLGVPVATITTTRSEWPLDSSGPQVPNRSRRRAPKFLW